MNTHHTNKGFTLIELLVVIAIIAVLSTVITGTLQSGRAKARNAERLQTASSIQKALETHATLSGTNSYPKGALATGWYCLGKSDSSAFTAANNPSGGVTGATGNWCGTTGSPATNGFDATLNSQIAAALSGASIPRNSSYPTTHARSYYRYNASYPGGGTPLLAAGAYLFWSMEGTNANCGNATMVFAGTAFDKNTTCALRLAGRQ